MNAAHGVSHDALVIGWEQALFSGQPSLAWIRAFPRPAWSTPAWGTAFPSSHVAAGLVAALAAWRHLRPLGAVLVPLALLLSLGTVYGHLHYAVDALAGAAVGLCVDGLGRRAGYDSAPV